MASPMGLGCCPESNGRFLVARVVQMYVLTNEETQVASVQLPITSPDKRPVTICLLVNLMASIV